MPLPSARRTSITTTSGLVRTAWSMASRTEPASATTARSSLALISDLTPLRTTSWSSTSRTRILVLGTSAIVPPSGVRPNGPVAGQREHDTQAGASAVARDFQRSPQRRCSFPHVAQPIAIEAAPCVEAGPVVFDYEHRIAAGSYQLHLRMLCIRVTDHVGEGLAGQLHDLVRSAGKSRRELRIDINHNFRARARLNLLTKDPKRIVELPVGKDSRTQPEDVVP